MNRRLLTLLCSAGLLAALASPAGAAGVAGDLRWRSALAVPARSADDLVAVRLDGPLADAIAPGFADLRIVDSADRAVPLVIRTGSVVKERVVRTARTVVGPRLEPRDDGGVEITFTIDPAVHTTAVHGFRIVTPLVNFQQRVRVERRGADGLWTVLVEDGLLCDYSQWLDARSTDLAFPAGERTTVGGTYRITIAEATAEQQSQVREVIRSLEHGVETGLEERFVIRRQPFRIDRIEAWHDDTVADLRAADPVPRTVRSWSVVEDDEAKVSRIRVETGGGPVTALRLVVADRNFRRDVTVTGPADPARRRGIPAAVLGQARIERLDLRGLAREQLAVPIQTTGKGPFEIAIARGDNPPLRVTGIEAVGPAYTAVFLAVPGETYRLAYGRPEEAEPLPTPCYDIAAIETALAAGRIPTTVAAGPATEVPFAAPAVPISRVIANPWVLGSVIVMLAALLALALVQAARRIDPVPAGRDPADEIRTPPRPPADRG